MEDEVGKKGDRSMFARAGVKGEIKMNKKRIENF